MSALTEPITWRQPAKSLVPGFVMGLLVVSLLLVEVSGSLILLSPALVILYAPAAPWHAHRSAAVTRLGIILRFLVASLIPSVILPVTFLSLAGSLMWGAGSGAAVSNSGFTYIAWTVLFVVPMAVLVGLAAAWLLFVPAPVQAGAPVTAA